MHGQRDDGWAELMTDNQSIAVFRYLRTASQAAEHFDDPVLAALHGVSIDGGIFPVLIHDQTCAVLGDDWSIKRLDGFRDLNELLFGDSQREARKILQDRDRFQEGLSQMRTNP